MLPSRITPQKGGDDEVAMAKVKRKKSKAYGKAYGSSNTGFASTMDKAMRDFVPKGSGKRTRIPL